MPDPQFTPDELATDPTETAFATVVDILQTDPDLARLGITWRVWDGSGSDAAPPQVAEMPWVRLTPIASPMDGRDVDTYHVLLRILVEFATRGTHRADLFNLWGALRRATNYNKAYQASSVGAVLRVGAAVTLWTASPNFRALAPPPATPNAPSPAPQALIGSTLIELPLDLDSLS